ncbi:MAG TPA: HAD family hydrolase [Dyella sp.]|uniref:HAD family hydrolase n=1 Tax=Dyella sp. TaxID=1869338 RepID=UPI002D768055|nr:HAD family hydrolase [Dyella sp.]HET6554042.1 HAD family hydrolase [Dyella sp.]
MNLALFDFDGTITQRELFRPFLEFAVPPARLRWGGLLLSPMVVGYKLGVVSPNAMRACAVRVGLQGMDDVHAQEMGRRFADEIIPTVLRPHAMERIRWHQQQGDRVVVVSGALDVYLSHWCRQHGLELVCSLLEVRGGRMTGRYLGPQCVGAQKQQRVRAAYDVDAYPLVYAYGDTHEDRELLQMAHRRYFQWQEQA